MRVLSTRTKIFGGFGAALAVAVVGGLAGYLASRAVGQQLELVSESQFPVARALSGLETGFRDAQRFLNTMALSRQTAVVLQSADCRDCHAEATIFAGRADESLDRIEASLLEVDALPRSPAVADAWPTVRTEAADWLRQAHLLRGALARRAGLAASPEPAGTPEAAALEAAVWSTWRDLHGRSEPLQQAIGALVTRLKDEASASRATADRAQHRGEATQLAALLLAVLVMGALGALIGRSVGSSVRALVRQTGKLTEAAIAGRLETRADAAEVPPEFRPVVEGLNGMLEAVHHPLNVAARSMDQIARGDVPERIQEPWQGDFGRIRDGVNAVIGAVSGLLGGLDRLAQAHARGETDARVDEAAFAGAYARLAHGLNASVGQYVDVLEELLVILSSYAAGDFRPELRQLPGRLGGASLALGSLRGNLVSFSAEVQALAGAAMAGRLSTRADAAAFHGDWRALVEGVNGTLDAVTGPLGTAAACVDRLAAGQVPHRIEERWPGDFDTLKGNLNRCIGAIEALVADADRLAEAAVEGRLSTRADPARHQGDYRRIVEGVNRTLDSTIAPVEEAATALERLAARDLCARVTGDYRGDHARMKAAVNGAAGALQSALREVADSVGEVASAAGQIAASSQAVAAGASEQAASLTQTTSSLEAMSDMTRSAADHAQSADGMASTARRAAQNGTAATHRLTDAMGKIRAASEGTAQIIRDINDIAFQTNLLALNAAVEAARAGEAGRGFAVVAEEVRSLALRSKEAAQKTEALIRESVRQSEEGEAVTREVAARLDEIAGAVSQVTATVGEITGSTKDQASGIDQVTRAVAEMDKVTQQNAASAEESSSAAAELSSQAGALEEVVGSFRLEDGGAPATPAAPRPGRLQARA